MTNHIDSLATRIKQASDAYYNGLPPLMSDATWDALVDELRRLDPGHPILTAIGAPVQSSGPLAGGGWPKVKHTIPMSSLNKAQVEADMDVWAKSCNATDDIIAMDKLDGLSVSLEYKNRRLVRALTRGDGETGEDITRNVLLMKGAVKVLPPVMPNGLGGTMNTPASLFARGEMVVTHDDFKFYFKGESNPRNTASGTAKRQSDPAKCAYLTVIVYNCMPNGVSMSSKSSELQTLSHLGFVTPRWSICQNMATVRSVYAGYIAGIRKNIGYDIDGLVYEVNDTTTREALGDLNGRPRGAIAYKFPHESQSTTLDNIRWQVGQSGRITPVAEFATVNLAGANVVQASLHNISFMSDLVRQAGSKGFPRKGDTIIVSRRNDVIPYVESILVHNPNFTIEFAPPTECPSCKFALTRDGEYLVCRNDECEAQASGAIKRWVQKVGVLHVGDALIDAMVEAGMVSDPADLYTLDASELAELDIGGRRAGGTADKAIHNLNAKKTMTIHTLVGSVGIPLIGRSMAQTISDGGYSTLSKMMKAKISDIAKIPGVGSVKAEAFVLGFQAKAGLIAKLIGNGIEISSVTGALVGQTMCQTGFRDADMVEEFERQGGSIKSSASKGTTYLVALDPNGNSGKLASARKNGVSVIGVDEMWTILGGKK